MVLFIFYLQNSVIKCKILQILVEECPAVKEEAKDPIKEEGNGRSNSVTALDGTTDGEEDDDEEASEHTSPSGAGLMHDLLAIPGGVGQQQVKESFFGGVGVAAIAV